MPESPAKAQYWVREVMNRLYKAQPDGYCGDEDNGQTSAWYVLLGPRGSIPSAREPTSIAVGAPLFRRATIHSGERPENRDRGPGKQPRKPLRSERCRSTARPTGRTLPPLLGAEGRRHGAFRHAGRTGREITTDLPAKAGPRPPEQGVGPRFPAFVITRIPGFPYHDHRSGSPHHPNPGIFTYI